jgi:hypothetical protein
MTQQKATLSFTLGRTKAFTPQPLLTVAELVSGLQGAS